MPRFLQRVIVTPLADGDTWYLDDNFQYESTILGADRPVTVPKGFETDFASIPSPITIVLPKWSDYGPAAIIHDWLYWSQSIQRRDADNVFLEAMQALNVSPIKQRIIYLGVRIFGRWAWWENGRLKARSVSRMRPPNATWPALPSWHRTRFSRRGLFPKNKNSIGPFSPMPSAS
jgi:hypothetical protein